MKTEFHNCPEPKGIDSITLPETPAFLAYQPNFAEMKKLVEQYLQYKNIVIIGHGGSISSIWGIYSALKFQATKNFYTLCTIDPDYISDLKKIVTPNDTLVIAISRSGETVTQIEALLHFTEFPLLVITSSMGPLAEIADKLGAKTIPHPPISGRFSGMTEVALVPAILFGLDVEAIFSSAQKWYKQYSQNNDAYQAASTMYLLEEQGVVDVFMPIYDWNLFSMTSLLIQLCHEGFGKDGKGQSYFAHHAPESQHHTNQRFFGGRQNIAGWFISSDQPIQDFTTVVPEILKDIPLKEKTLGVLDGIPLSIALKTERDATLEDAKLQNIPVVNQILENHTASEIGSLIAFWQLYAVYSSVLRGVNPFDQPQVENSKKISFAKRLQYKGLL